MEEIEFDEQFFMEKLKQVEENYETAFIPEYFELRMPKVAAAFFVLCFEDQWLNSIPPGSKLANLHYLLLLSPLLLHLSDLWTQKMERHLWPQLSFGGVQSQE